MMTKLKALFFRYKEAILYLFFGGCTTLVNILSYYVCDKAGLSTSVSTIIAWFLSVLFAYVTNKLYVFESKITGLTAILKEAGQFIFFRVVTGVFDLVFMVLTVDMLHAPGVLMKILSNVFVVVLNYVFSKLLIFRKDKSK